MLPKIKMIGLKFGRLTVTEYRGRAENGLHLWGCTCSCGEFVITAGKYLRNKDTQSCGCWQREATSMSVTKHGHNKKHSPSPEYQSWANMLTRCTNPNSDKWERYGARGIKVCERWKDFRLFLTDMGLKPTPKHMIERKNNDGDYCPANCVWATNKEQSLNRVTTINVTHDGVTNCLSDWERYFKVGKDSIARRLRRGDSFEDAVKGAIKRRRKTLPEFEVVG